MQEQPTQTRRIYIQRFKQYLNATNHTFSVFTNTFIFFNSNVAFIFSNEGVEVIRPSLPDRCIAYDKVNFDRLVMLK